ncbi:MAG TPA: hypothetical protein DEP72_03985 [Clostridiales bacterium]|nr:MAG: hypothetical protein A2Y18_04260 [Clostridiales bacterium GWD2_32_19]HCC07306.1 hypothetical protein [Clostridiales bacterium]
MAFANFVINTRKPDPIKEFINNNSKYEDLNSTSQKKVVEFCNSVSKLNGLNDIDKIMLVNNYLQENTQYYCGRITEANNKKYEVECDDGRADYSNPNSTIEKGYGNCNSISSAFRIICHKLDVIVDKVDVGEHSYCIYDYNGKTYIIDPTWGCSRNENQVNGAPKATRFSDKYIMVALNDLKDTGHHTVKRLEMNDRTLATEQLDREIITSSVEKLKSQGMVFQYSEEPILKSKEIIEKEVNDKPAPTNIRTAIAEKIFDNDIVPQANKFEIRRNMYMGLVAKQEENLQKALEKYTDIQGSSIDRKEVRLEVASKTIAIKKMALAKTLDRLEFLRPESKEDIAYRLRQCHEFPSKIRQVIPDDLPLRFHGTSIYNAKHILHDGELSSSADRIGVETSYDTNDQVSVTTKQTIETTVSSYTDLTGDYCIPAGCIFVLLPKDEIDEKAGDSLLMGNVNFKSEPDRLVAIITSNENIPNIHEWSSESNVNESKIYDFDGFIQTFEKLKESSKVTTVNPITATAEEILDTYDNKDTILPVNTQVANKIDLD